MSEDCGSQRAGRIRLCLSRVELQWSRCPQPDRSAVRPVVELHTESDLTQLTEHRLDKEQTPSEYCLLVVSSGRKTGRVCDQANKKCKKNRVRGGIKTFPPLDVSPHMSCRAFRQNYCQIDVKMSTNTQIT